ncbi:MAG: ERAP1-like C-terminal domain-containing protein, partial [Nitrosopumilus sp.]
MEEKLRFLGAMCNFRDEKLLIKTLQFSLTSEVRSQNMQLPIMRIAANPYGKKILWSWLKKNWSKLRKKVGSGNPLFNRIVASISLIADDSMEKEIIQFFKSNPTPGTERIQAQTLERIRIHSKFLRHMKKEFKNQYG